MGNRITQADIANKTNVSRVTVSKVLNGSGGVSSDISKKVIDTATELGYFSAKNPVLPTSDEIMNNIVFLGRDAVSAASSPFWMPMIAGVEKTLRKHNAALRVAFIPANQESIEDAVRSVISQNPNGIIFAGDSYLRDYEFLDTLNIPYVAYDYVHIPGKNLLSIGANCDIIALKDRIGTAKITEKFIKNGHKRIVFVSGTNGSFSFHNRYLGYVDAMKKNGLEPERLIDIEEKIFNSDSAGSDIARNIGAHDKKPTAYVCANDCIAYQILRQQKLYRDVFGDIQVCGFDNFYDLPFDSAFAGTVDFDKNALGVLLAERILSRIENPKLPYSVTIMDVEPKFRE